MPNRSDLRAANEALRALLARPGIRVIGPEPAPTPAQTPEPKPKPPRRTPTPPPLTPPEDTILRGLIRSNPRATAYRVARLFGATTGRHVSPRTVTRRIPDRVAHS